MAIGHFVSDLKFLEKGKSYKSFSIGAHNVIYVEFTVNIKCIKKDLSYLILFWTSGLYDNFRNKITN